jgi:hypothetical protein
MNLVHTRQSYFFMIHFNILYSSTSKSSQCFFQVFTPLFSLACYILYPSHPSWVDNSNNLRGGIKLCSSSLCNFLQAPITWSLLDPNIIHSTPFSYSLHLFYSLNVRYWILHPYKITGKIIILYILIFGARGSVPEGRGFDSRWGYWFF